jgi:hypothetical protein
MNHNPQTTAPGNTNNAALTEAIESITVKLCDLQFVLSRLCAIQENAVKSLSAIDLTLFLLLSHLEKAKPSD